MSSGVDRATLTAYDAEANAYAEDWHAQPPPSDLHAAVRRHFRRGGVTADVDCGSGRDVAWLNASGYPCVGFDASEGLLAEARRRYSALTFQTAALPELPSIDAGSFDNVLCETVIMHLPSGAVKSAVLRLVDILKVSGHLYLTWRVTREADQRDGKGRLYASFDVQGVRDALGDAEIALDEEITSASSGKTIHRIVARKR